MKKACLFGGTLVAAGLTGTASAQAEFSIAYVYSAIVSTSTASFGSDSDNATFFSGPFSLSAAFRDGSALALGSASEFRVEAADGDEIATSTGQIRDMEFTVTESTVALLTWDASTTYASGLLVLRDLSTNTPLVDLNLGPNQSAGGLLNIPLTAGVFYELTFSIQTGQVSSGDSASSGFISLVVPAPSSAALLGLGGLLATRRRR
ncbi:MAG: PEP-CTERM sorting domain-containing protein [Phycisphaerales bacterium JB037]